MLFGNVEQLNLIPFADERISQWIAFALESSKKPDGKYEFGEDGVFAMVVNGRTEAAEVRKPEIHKHYVDIQILLEGEEKLGYSNVLSGEIAEIAELENDVMFLEEVKNEQYVFLNPGDFALFYPNQIHRPLCSVEKDVDVKKAILKIPAELFTK
ncbi:YhcH/YjgK/YiaL family protein [Vibrio hannami]|uniref:YhcH/YjgK/YiaL family protein n=1 Tax=Vibrio hannami TaxID=2717094 RepID=UPI0024102AC2|nr:YhcH/YjgK/YiaL family protein [Vibrio hannami]MDG3086313.1 YhcH/YjgK/YiaL family protein [Vibrio hannami]